jgi:uncharacterized protein DUF4350
MKQQLVTLLLALGAFAACYLLIFPKPRPDTGESERPLSTSEGAYGYLGAWRWLSHEHVPVESLRERFEVLPLNQSKNATGNIMLTTLPHLVPVRNAEVGRLDKWIENGNTLVVAAALDDTPRYAFAGGEEFIRQLNHLTRLNFEVIEERKTSTADKVGAALRTLASAGDINIKPRGTLPLMQDIHGLRATSELPASRWRATAMDSRPVLEIGEASAHADPAIWVRRQGKGQVIVIGVAGLFSNHDLGTLDNAQFLSNIVAWNLGPNGRFIFDDVHQGAAKYYDARAFFGDARLHRTLWWLILLWFVFVLGVQHLAVHANNWRPPDITAFVATSGEFFASTITPVAAGARLLANFFNGIRRRLGLPEDGLPVWEWLASQATVPLSEVQQLRRMQARIDDGRRVDLTRLQNLLVKVQGKII